MSPIVIPEISGVFVTTMIADVKYFVQEFENLLAPIQMRSS